MTTEIAVPEAQPPQVHPHERGEVGVFSRRLGAAFADQLHREALSIRRRRASVKVDAILFSRKAAWARPASRGARDTGYGEDAPTVRSVATSIGPWIGAP